MYVCLILQYYEVVIFVINIFALMPLGNSVTQNSAKMLHFHIISGPFPLVMKHTISFECLDCLLDPDPGYAMSQNLCTSDTMTYKANITQVLCVPSILSYNATPL